MVAPAQQGPCGDARSTCAGRHSAWLRKVKSDRAMLRWLVESGTRYFTIDFDEQVFYYAHSSATRNMSHLTSFKDILYAERFPRHAGFCVSTEGRTYEMYSMSNADAEQWVHAFNAASRLGQVRVPILSRATDERMARAAAARRERARAKPPLEDPRPRGQDNDSGGTPHDRPAEQARDTSESSAHAAFLAESQACNAHEDVGPPSRGADQPARRAQESTVPGAPNCGRHGQAARCEGSGEDQGCNRPQLRAEEEALHLAAGRTRRGNHAAGDKAAGRFVHELGTCTTQAKRFSEGLFLHWKKAERKDEPRVACWSFLFFTFTQPCTRSSTFPASCRSDAP